MVGNILNAKFILVILFGSQVYKMAMHRQESQNLAVLSQFTRRQKTVQPRLQNYATSRTLAALYTTDLDGN